MNNAIIVTSIICRLIWNIFIIAGTAYMVEWHTWSPWWILLAVCLIRYDISKTNDKDDDDSSNCGC